MEEGEKLSLPLGIDRFDEIRTGGYYYIDKSELISDIVAKKAKVYLFTRPRRFGKSLNLSMIDCFFNLRYRGNHWFDGLRVIEHPEAVARTGSYPVIHLNLSGLRVDDYENRFIPDFKDALYEVYDRFGYLSGSAKISPSDRRRFVDSDPTQFDETRAIGYISALCRMLKKHHGVKPIILIDEYDDPINSAFGKGSFDEILEFMKAFYEKTLKKNTDASFSVVTGVMQIAKESIFSGLNNLDVNNIFSTDSDERYGFTPTEVRDMCAYYGNPGGYDQARIWYDGYRFGTAEIYNPWSLINYIQSGFVVGRYWAGTSGNDIMEILLNHADERVFRDLDDIANDRPVTVRLSPAVALKDILKDRSAIYSVMAVAGYLKAVPTEEGYLLSVPNLEMREVYAGFMERRIHSDAEVAFGKLFNGLEQADTEKVRQGMQAILDDRIPFILLTDEKEYELIIGAAAMSWLGRYTVSLEKESGNGRADIVMERRSDRYPDIILELKRTRYMRRDILEKNALKAIGQIKEKEYFRRMTGRVLLWGLCFNQKDFGLAFEEIEMPESESRSRCPVRSQMLVAAAGPGDTKIRNQVQASAFMIRSIGYVRSTSSPARGCP